MKEGLDVKVYLHWQSVSSSATKSRGVSCAGSVKLLLQMILSAQQSVPFIVTKGRGVSWAVAKRQIIISDDVDHGGAVV